jgi:hypothetical protein
VQAAKFLHLFVHFSIILHSLLLLLCLLLFRLLLVMDALEGEFDRLGKRQKASMAKVMATVDALIQQVSTCRAAQANCNST